MEYRENPNLGLTKTALEEAITHMKEQSELLEAGKATPAFRDGNVEVCSGCGGNLERGCFTECNKLEAGFTYMDRILKKIAGTASQASE